MINSSEFLVAILAISAVAQTIYLRKELEEHHLHIWVYTSVPLMGISVFLFALWDELGKEIAEPLTYGFMAMTLITFFLGAVQALRRD